MTSPFLASYAASSQGLLLDQLPAIFAGPTTLTRILKFCRLYRVRAIAIVLLSGSTETLGEDLIKSGQAFLHFLKSASAEQKATGRSEPFYDAICAGDLSCAGDIARHSSSHWNSDHEYEDDFLFVRFLMELFFLDRPAGDCARTLQRHLEVVGDEDDAQQRLGQALLNADQVGFERALIDWLRAKQQEYRVLEKSGQGDEEALATEPHLSVPGLALIRLAERRNIRLSATQKGLPTFDLLPARAYPPDAWTRP